MSSRSQACVTPSRLHDVVAPLHRTQDYRDICHHIGGHPLRVKRRYCPRAGERA
jgi:hypothetical protein